MVGSFAKLLPEPSDLPSSSVATGRHWGFRTALCTAMVCATFAVGLRASAEPTMLFIWNVSPSVPTGLYRISNREALQRGDMVAAWAPPAAARLAAERRYLPMHVPLIKRVAAVHGDKVCARAAEIHVRDRLVASRLVEDGAGRRLPWWSGCRTLRTGDYFLLAPRLRSFDGRYFGVSSDHQIIGKAVLLWAR